MTNKKPEDNDVSTLTPALKTQFLDPLGEWAPKGVEASIAVNAAMADSEELGTAVAESTALLLNELLQEQLAGNIGGNSFQVTISVPKDNRTFAYYLLLLISNATKPGSRIFLMTPAEVINTPDIWDILGKKAQMSVDSMITAEAATAVKH
ncbi:MAG: hypothetical protein KKC03_13240 [Bacteroidetes bacterium]|nr:hypothetical protein [Bacteroidota bacterium]